MSTVPTSPAQLPQSSAIYAHTSFASIQPTNDDRVDLAQRSNIPAPFPSALATARIINDLGSVTYPEGVKSPSVELNIGVKDNKFRYDREFLLQFMSICKKKPDMLPPLDAIGPEPSEGNFPMSRDGSGRHRQSSNASAPQTQPSSSGFPSGSFGQASSNPFSMGMDNFGTSTITSSKLSSDERFNMSTLTASVGSASGFRPSQMQGTACQSGPGTPVGSNRVHSQCGEKRNESNKASQHDSSGYGSTVSLAQAMLGPVAPLQATANRWDRKALAVDPNSPEIVDRKVKGLLNKITMEKFDSISDQIIAWANKSENEKDGRTLIQVIRLVFEKATDEAAWSEMYARLCRKMMEQISNRVQDDGIKGQGGAPITGGHLFRKYLLNRCQEDFERGWVANEAIAAEKAGRDASISENINIDYAVQKARHRGLGFIKFMGELFKLQMLPERIMHECVKKLLGNVDNPEEEEIESLCKLLATVGEMLDTQKARAHMDVYFSRMKKLRKSSNVSPRIQFMLQDIIELRERRWVYRNAVAAPATIAQIHEAAAKEKAVAEKESYQRHMTMSRGGSRRGGDCGEQQQVGPDGWTTAGSASRAPPKAGDLSKFGQINKGSNAPLTFGPQSNIYSGKKDKRESIQRTNSQNMFSMLQNSETPAEPSAPKEPTQRKKLVLAPRSKPIESTTAETEQGSDDEVDSPTEESAATEMSPADAKKKIGEDLKEFFAVRNLDEAEDYFKSLPALHHHLLVDKLVSYAIESKAADAQLVAEFFTRASSKSLCASAAFEEGIGPVTEFLDDIAIDAPKAPSLLAIIINGANLSEEQRRRLASKSEESGATLLRLTELRVRQHPIGILTSAPIHRTEIDIISVAEATQKITQYSEEFFATRDLEKAEIYFRSLPAVYHFRLVDRLVYPTIESNEADARLVGDFFARASSKGLCSPAAFEEGIAPTAEFLDDIAIDAPGAPDLLAIMMKGAKLSDAQRARISSKSEEHCAMLLELSKPPRLPFSFLRDTSMSLSSDFGEMGTVSDAHVPLITPGREKTVAEKKSYQPQMRMSRGGFGRGTAGSAPRVPPKAGALSKFGQIIQGSNAPLTFGPQSNIYSGKKDKRESIQRTNSQNMFSMLQNSETPAEPSAPKEPTQRKKLVLAPRFKPGEFTTADARKKIEEDLKEFFAVRNLDKAEGYFKSLPASHHHLLVDKLVSYAIESKAADAQLIAEFFARASSKSLCASAAFEEGIAPVAEFLDAIAIDAPKAPSLLAIMIKGADLSEEQRRRLASKSEGSGAKLLELIS